MTGDDDDESVWASQGKYKQVHLGQVSSYMYIKAFSMA